MQDTDIDLDQCRHFKAAIADCTDRDELWRLVENAFDLNPDLTWAEEAQAIKRTLPHLATLLEAANRRWHELMG